MKKSKYRKAKLSDFHGIISDKAADALEKSIKSQEKYIENYIKKELKD